MFQKILLVVGVIAVVFLGVYTYRTMQNTADKAAQQFVTQLTKGETSQAYKALTADLAKDREQYWQDYLKQFKTESQPMLVGSTSITDAFNTYTAKENPTRILYSVQVADREYTLQMVLIRQEGTWKIDELQSSHK